MNTKVIISSIPGASIKVSSSLDKEQKEDDRKRRTKLSRYDVKRKLQQQQTWMKLDQCELTEQEIFLKLREKRRSPPFLTKFERAQIIGTIAIQINNGCRVFSLGGKNDLLRPKEGLGDEQDSRQQEKRHCDDDEAMLLHNEGYFLAKRELREGHLPFLIQRFLPDGSFEIWKLSELLQIQDEEHEETR